LDVAGFAAHVAGGRPIRMREDYPALASWQDCLAP
jgi:hypothetical protein